ncbi:MAG: LLM class flavin-dependent oxidoreductase [Actinomycetota bacterium]
MRIGLSLPHYDFSYPDSFSEGHGADLGATLEWARRAERLGYDSVWVSDHFFLDMARYGGPDSKLGSLEPIVTLAAIASQTSKVSLGTLVLCEAFRPPATLAKQATMLDLLSNGRLELGLGAGWNEPEYTANGFAYLSDRDRITRLRETLQIIQAMLSSKSATFEGKHYAVRNAVNAPMPKRKPPVFVGAKGGDRMLRIIARYADGWNTVWKWTVADYKARSVVLDRECEIAGREVKRSIGLYSIVSDDAARVFDQWKAWAPKGMLSTLEDFREGTLIGSAQQCAEKLAEFAALGVEELIVAPAPLPFAVPVAEQVDQIAEELIPLAREI